MHAGFSSAFSLIYLSVKAQISAKHAGVKPSKVIACLGIMAFMIMMLSKPDFYLDSARRGLALFATSVLPSLFPFYFSVLLLTNIGAAKSVSRLFGGAMRKLYGAPPESAYVLLLSLLSGYPVGASLTAELYGANIISRSDAKKIASFASTAGPIFMLGTVGSAIYGDVKVGAVVMAAHVIAALLNGFIFSIGRKKSAPSPAVALMATEQSDSVMSRTISSATINMLYVGGYIVLCGMLVDTLSLLKVDMLLEKALGEAATPVFTLIAGAIEMTRGSLLSASCARPLGVSLCAAIISFGGLSVTLQNYTFLSRTGMTFWQIIVRKITHCLLAFGIAYPLALLL